MKLTEEQRKIAEKYGHMFYNTGGNDPVELIEREHVNYFNNPLVAEMQGSCYSQLKLIELMLSKGMLVNYAFLSNGFDVQVIVSGPGECFSYEMIVIQKALTEAGVDLTIKDRHPDPNPEMVLEQERKRIESGKYKQSRVELIAKHHPWGG